MCMILVGQLAGCVFMRVRRDGGLAGGRSDKGGMMRLNCLPRLLYRRLADGADALDYQRAQRL